MGTAVEKEVMTKVRESEEMRPPNPNLREAQRVVAGEGGDLRSLPEVGGGVESPSRQHVFSIFQVKVKKDRQVDPLSLGSGQ